MRPVLEREVKWRIDRDAHLPDLGGLGGVRALPEPTRRLVADYFDTADHRLVALGVTLRRREGEGATHWTLKLPVDAPGASLARREVDFPDSGGRPPAVARAALGTPLAGRRLRRVCRIVSERSAWHLLDADGGRAIGLLCDDRVRALGPGLALRAFREVELELAEEAPPRLATQVARLLEAQGARRSPRAKLARALFGDGDGGSETHGDLSAAGLVRGALSAGARRLMVEDPAVRLDLDPEDVHQARVAVRRLRSQLRTFRAFVDPAWADGLRAELAWLGGALGQVRDLDVLGQWLVAQAPSLGREERGQLVALGDLAAGERAEALTRLSRTLGGARYRRLARAVAALADAPPDDATVATMGASDLDDALGRTWRRLRRAVDRLADPPRDEDLHRVRILAKHARYAFEAAAAGIGRDAARLAGCLADLQGDLGEIQDACAAEAWLRRAAASEPTTALVVGELVAARQAQAGRARSRWPHTWRRARHALRRLRAAERLG